MMMLSQSLHQVKKITLNRVETRNPPEVGHYQLARIYIEMEDGTGAGLLVDLACFGDKIEVKYEPEPESSSEECESE
jgi:hypothetical protein